MENRSINPINRITTLLGWLILLVLLIGFNNAHAAVAIDARSSGGKASGNSLTIPHTTSGSNRLMLVGFSIEDNQDRQVSSMTYNGVSLSLVGSREISGKPHIEIWKLVNPPTGSHNVIINLDGLQDKGMVGGVVTFTGVDQTTPLGTFASSTGEASQASVNVSAAIGDIVFATVMRWHNPLGNVGSGETQQWKLDYDKTHGGGSTETATSTSVNMSWSESSQQWAMGGVAVKAVNDTTAPAAVSNLATSNPQLTSIDLGWTAPGDDNNDAGTTATTYDIRYRTDTAITAGNWATATQVTGEPSPSVQGTSESMTVTGLSNGTTYYFAIRTDDEIPNTSAISNSPSGTTIGPPVGGYSVDDVIPVAQISQETDGSGNISINWKVRDSQVDNVTLNTFQYSDDGGASWYTPNNGDASGALSVNWDDNGGGGWSTATSFGAATAHNFSFNTQHADVTAVQSLDNVDQSDIQIRFTVNDGSVDSINPATSQSVRIDNLGPDNTIVSGSYNPDNNTLVISGTNFTSIASASTDIKSIVDWSKFVWDINGDNGVSADISVVLGDVSSLIITNATTLTLIFTGAKATAIEATVGYGVVGGADTLDVAAGFSRDAFGNAATTDGVSNAPITITNNPPVGGYTSDDVIPAVQISQVTDGSGIISINWKARDNQADNVTLNSFQYSDDGGSTWFTPNNADATAALSANWNDNGGSGWSTATSFGAATPHNFSFNTQHADVTAVRSLDNVDQSDIQIRFTVNDGSIDSDNPATSQSVRVDNLAPNNTIVSGSYNADSDTLILTGTNFTSIAPASTDIKSIVDWTKFVWDINGDNAVSADLSVVLGDVTSLTVTNATTLTLVFAGAKGTAIEATAGFGAAGGADTLDVTAGFSIDVFGNAATTDGVSDASLDFAAPVGGYTSDDVIPAAQISQATDGSGIISINWKARDNQGDNVTLNTFQYSDDGGSTWFTPNNADATAALSANWDDNGGGGWSTASTFAAATAHSFSFNTQHADVTAVRSLDNIDQSDIQIRFTLNDGGADSVNPAASESVRVDNLSPNNTMVSGAYDADTDTLVISGTNFTSIAAASTDIKTFVDWSKFVWDINGDDAATANIGFVLGDISSLTVTNATTLTLVFTGAKATAIEASTGYGAAGGADTFDITAGFSIDVFGNAATSDALSNGALTGNNAPLGGFSVDDLIPAGQISQATDGSGVITINWKARDDQSDNVRLHTFLYSDDGGSTWYTPNNGDVSGAFSANWDDNGGGGWSSATTFGAATAHSFSFNTQHADVTAVRSLDNVDQSDIQIRFMLNDGSIDSVNPATSQSVRVDNLSPNNTIVSGTYNSDADTLLITGTNFTSIAPASTDIKSLVDWSKLVWDINGDDAVTANISFVLGDVSSLIVTNATTLTLVFTGAKGTAIEATAGFGAAGGADTLDVTAGFSIDAFGNAATTDGVNNAPLNLAAPVGGYTADDVIPATQISQATDGSGIITINWKARDDQSDNVSLHSFQYSDDGGASWYTPNNGDTSAALSVNWDDNGGGGWSSATTFGVATVHSFSFNTQHVDVTAVQSLDNLDQSDIQIRFTVNDGSADSVSPATSASIQVDNLAPNNTIVSSSYNPEADRLVITGTNFTSIAPALTDIKSLVDWTKFVWDINGDNAGSADITFVLGDVGSLTVTDATTLTLVFASAKATAIEATAGYGAAGGADTLDVAAGFSIDVFGNAATSDGVSNAPLDLDAPVGGYTADDVIPTTQISQATDGSGIITINWKARDDQSDNVILHAFQYSDDGGGTWFTPINGDISAALSVNWNNNGGTGWSTATTFAAATAHSFSFNTQHADVTAAQSLNNVDQSDIQIRFMLSDGSADSINPATSESVRVDNLAPNNTIVSGVYDADTDTLVITGTNFTSIAPASTDIKSYVDWSKLVWDINSDDAVTANITFVLGDIASLTVSNATTLTLVFTGAKGTAIEAIAGYGAVGGADTLDVTAGFSIDVFGNAATGDSVSNAPLAISNTPPVGGFSVDDVIPAGQISQASDGSGVITINWKARDNELDNVTLNTFQYSDDGGATWYTPNNGDASAALSANWDDNGGGWSTANTFVAASAHSFSFNTQHADVTAVQSLDNLDQSDIQIRFIVNDGNADSVNPATSESVQVDNLLPNNTIVSGAYNSDADTLVITGTNFISIAPASTDIKSFVDWSKLAWDINGDNAVTANISFVVGDVTSLTITNATTLTLVFAAAKGSAIETTAGYGATGGADTLDVTAGFSIDAFGNVATTDAVNNAPLDLAAPVGGYTADDVIPASQISQATDGSGVITINWKARDNQSDNVTLNTFQFSDDGGSTWYTPNNGDVSAALSVNWNDNGGPGWSTETTFAAAIAHSFTFNTQHADVTAVQSLDNVDQSDIQARFTVNDGGVDSVNPATSESVRVDNLNPNNTIVSAAYDAGIDTLVITGTNFTSIATASTDIKIFVDWSKLVWDINGDDAITANISFVVGDVTSLTITNATTLTLVLTGAKATAIEATAGYGAAGGADTLDVTVGFSIDAFGNVATTDGVSNGALATNGAPVGGYTVDDVIPAGQISQATDGSGVITINWKARDDQSDNVSLHSFQYSDDGGSTWYTPNNGDASAALSANWDDNSGGDWSSATTLAAATAHSFTFNTQHADVTAVQSLNNVDQSDIQLRFTLNDGSIDSSNPATSENVRVDNLDPNDTIVSSAYNAATDTLVITGTNFTSIAPASTDIKTNVDWSRLVWDINGDDVVTADISFVLGDVSSLTVTNATTLTLAFTGAKASAIEAVASYGVAGGADTLDVTTGFSIDVFGNAATTDGLSDGLLAMTNIPPVGGYSGDDVIPAGQVSQATDGSGVITINWKARDNESGDVTLNTFQYSDDGGSTWYTPNNGDTSGALSANWDDNGGAGWSSAATFAAATAHSFSFNTQHADVTAVQTLDNVDQSDIQIRFTVNDGSVDSVNPAASASVSVDNLDPSNTIVSSIYNDATDTLIITGTNFTSIAPASTDIKDYVDWTKLVWDINSDDAVSADITFVAGDVANLTITNDTSLTLAFTGAKGTAIETTAGFGAASGADSIDVTVGFSVDAFGNASSSDGVNDGLLIANTSISGTVYSDDDEVTPLAGETVRLLINGVDSGLTDITDASGNYRIETTPSPGDLLLVYIDSGGGNQGTVVSASNGQSFTGANIYQNHIVVRHDNAGIMSNAMLNSATNGDTDIQYAVVLGNLTVGGANELYIPGGHSYIPGGNVTTPSMESLGTFDGGANTIDINGALSIAGGNFTASSAIMSIQGDYALSAGTFTHNSGTVVFDGENQTLTGSTTFNNLTKTDSVDDATDVSLIFDNNATQTIIGTLTLDGLDDDERVNLVSDNPGNQWSINLAVTATKAINFVDVMDSDASGSDAAQIPINPPNSINSGNNLQWFSDAVNSVMAEIDRVSIPVSSVAYDFNYDVMPTIDADDSGVNLIAITAPADFANLAVNTIYVGGSEQAANCPTPGTGEYCAAIADQVMAVTLGSKITATGTNVRIHFTADAPDAVGSGDFTAMVDDIDTAQASAQIATVGDADGDGGDANSQTVNVIAFNGLDNSTFVADPLIVIADGVATSTLTATLIDNSNVAVPGKAVTFASDRGLVDTVNQPTGLSNSNGVAVGSIRSTTPGVVTLAATDTTDGITLTEQPQIYFSQGMVLDLTKTANKEDVVVGDIVTYQIEIKNTADNDVDLVTLEDHTPPNFKYLKGSTRLDGAPIADPSGNRSLEFNIGTVSALVDTNGNGEADPQEQGYLLLSYQLIVGAGATPGDYVNTAHARDVCATCVISNTVSETVEVVLDPFFDLGTIIGKVFDDKNEDGWQDKGEDGIAGAMVVLDDGTYVLTDSHGRYHLPAVQPGQRLLKLNSHSLPSGTRFTTPITQVVSVTPGLLVKANFGARHRVELKKIGREGESSVNVERKEVNESTVDVYGSVAMQNLFVNGTEIPVSNADVNMYTSGTAQDILYLSDGLLNEVVGFDMTTNRSPNAIKGWELQILTPEGEVLRSIKADGSLPPAIAWDGRKQDNTPVEGGRVYHYQLTLDFWDGNRATSPRRLFHVNEESGMNINMKLTGDTFEQGDINLSATAKDVLKNLADNLRKYPKGKIFINGHTDAIGSSESNMALSKARAEAAARYLVSIEDIPRSRLEVRGFGETQPVASNVTPEQRSLNRRIEIHGYISKVALAKTYRRFYTEPRLSINGEKIDMAQYFTFRETRVLAEAENLAVVMQDRFGRSSLTHLYAPKLQLPNQVEGESYRIVFPPKGDHSSGITVSEYYFEGTTVPGSAIEFDGVTVRVADDGSFRHRIRLKEGTSTHSLIVTAPSGYTRISTFELTAVDHDEAGRPLYLVEPVPFLELDVPQEGAHVESNIYTVSGKTDQKNAIFVDDEEVTVEADGSFSHTVNLNDGHNLISVRAVNPEGFVGSVEHGVEASNTDIFFMAFADGKFGQLEGKGYLEGAGMQERKEYYNEGRVAYYLKGVIKGKYLITSAFDSGTGEINQLLDGLDEKDNSKLFTNLDPDKLYPVYGDSSTLVYDIQSQGKFYLALESDEVNVVVGNYVVGFNDTELASYRRTLYGARASYESLSESMSGRADTKVIVFGAEVKQAPVQDELRATGGSLYYLSHSDIIEGGEQVTLVVRDKDTGLTLSRTMLRRNIDYRIYYDQGRLITSDPVSSVVEDRQSLFDSSIMPGNPVFLEVNYEARLKSFEKTAYGARVSKTLGKNVAVGVTQINDELDQDAYELSGIDAEMRIGRAVRLLGEMAQSSGVDSQTYFSLDGGLSYNNVTPDGELNGEAWKAAMELDVGELFGDPGRMFVDAYIKRLSDGFLAMGNFLERGTRKTGLNVLYSLSTQSKLAASYTTEESDVDVSNPTAITDTDILSLQWRYDASRWGVTTEYQSRDLKDASGNQVSSNKYATGQVRYQVTEKVSTRLEHQQTISGIENDQTTLGADYQVTESTKMTGAVVQGTQGRAAKAGIHWLFDGGKLYLDERMTQNNAGQSSTSTVIGGESQLSKNARVYSEYQIENADAGDKQISLIGADRFWQLQKGLLFKLAGEHSLINGDISDRERYALSASLSYKGLSGLSWSTRGEVRRDKGDKELLQYLVNFLIEQKLNPDYTLLFKYKLSQTRNVELDTIDAAFNEHSIGIAYRPVASDRFNLLARYTGISDKRPLNLGQLNSQETQLNVFSVEWSFDLTRRLEWVDKLAFKAKTEETSGYSPVTTNTWLSIHRLNFQFANAWYMGAEYRTLAQRQANDRRDGWLTEVMWRANKHMRLGAGYNFTDFSDNEYSDNNYSVKGVFVRLQGMY